MWSLSLSLVESTFLIMQPNQDPFVNSAKNYALHQYLDRDRSRPLIAEELTYASVGHLLETYVDALHVMLLMDEPSFLIRVKDQPELIRNPTFIRATHRLPPSYVIEALGNYLESPSFFIRHQIGRSNEPARQDTKQPSATQFAQEAHGLLRQLGIRFAENVQVSYFPPRGMGELISADQWFNIKRGDVAGAVQAFRASIEDYKQLFQSFSKNYRLKHFPPSEGESLQSQAYLKAEEKKIIFDAFEASDQLAAYNESFAPRIEAVRKLLMPPKLQQVFVSVGGDPFLLENKQLSQRFPYSSPALLHLALGFVGRHQIDRTFFPQLGFNFLLGVIGVESSVSDNIELLNTHIAETARALGRPFTDDPLFSKSDRALFLESVSNHRQGMQLLHLFHRTAGILERIYPPEKQSVAYQDIEHLLALDGAGVEIDFLQRPEEAATLLYSIERRIRATNRVGGELYQDVGMLLNKAGHLGRKNHFTDVSQKLRGDILGALAKLENHDEVENEVRRAIFPALQLVRKSLSS